VPAAFPNIGRTIRNIRRAREIIAVFAEEGFEETIQELDLDKLVMSGKRMVGLARPGEKVKREPQAVRLRGAMERLGPTFIKLAQILSTRRDLVPVEWAEEFAKLQDTVPAVPPEEIRPFVEELYGEKLDELFDEIEWEAFAAASIAQAHRATLADGTKVVLKVLRPTAREVLERDIEIMKVLAHFIEDQFEHMGYSPKKVVEQFERQVFRETDLRLEGRSIRRMDRGFEDNPNVGFPKVYTDQTRDGALCLERIDAALLSKMLADDNHLGFTQRERRDIVAHGSDAVFRQCFEIGFFHADPHPGNIFVLRDQEVPGGIRLVFIDCGMTGHIDPKTAEMLADLVHGTINGELDAVIDVVLSLTDADPRLASDRPFRADVWEFISRFHTDTIAELQMGSLLQEFFEKVRRHHLETPPDIVYLIKAVTTIEGVGEAVDPSFDLVGHVRPHLERLVRKRYGFRAIRRRVRAAMVGYADLVERVPRDARDVLQLIRRDRLEIKLRHIGIERLTDELESASGNISNALVVSALLMSGAILFLADAAAGPGINVLSILGSVAIALAFIMAVYRLISRRL